MTPEFVERVLTARAVVMGHRSENKCLATMVCDGTVAAGVKSCRRHKTAEEYAAEVLLRRWLTPFVDRWFPQIWPACWFLPVPEALSAPWPTSISLFEWQRGRCAICGEEHQPRSGSLVMDHDHTTGLVRGWLCGNCNAAEGHSTLDGRFLNYRHWPPADIVGLRLPYDTYQRSRKSSRETTPGQLDFAALFEVADA